MKQVRTSGKRYKRSAG